MPVGRDRELVRAQDDADGLRRDPTKSEVHDLAALDAMRAFAAIGVLLAHTAAVLVFRGIGLRWASVGDAGVLVFFVLSGYLIALSVLRQPRFDVRQYMIRRALRILPLYYASMIVALVLIDPTSLLSRSGRADVVTHIFLLHGLSRGMRYSISGVWWTLTVEWLFYVFMAIVAPVFRRRNYGWYIAIGLIVCGIAWRFVIFRTATSPGDATYLIQQLPGAADLFGVGMLLALLAYAGVLHRLWKRAWLRGSLLVLSALFVALAMYTYYEKKPTYWQSGSMVVLWPFALALGVAGLIACFARSTSSSHVVSRRSGLAFLGLVSFGIYLFHPFVIDALARAWFADGRTVSALPFILVALAGTVLVATMFHYGIERPAMLWGRRITASSRAQPRNRVAAAAPDTASTPARPAGAAPMNEADESQQSATPVA